MQRPLIAHILFRLDYGGLENGLVNLLNGLPDHHRHAVICLTDYSSFRERIRRPDVEVFALHKKPGKDWGAYGRLFKLLRRLRPAATHTRNPGVLDCAAVAAAAGVPVRIQGYHGWDVDDLYGRNPKRRLQRRLFHPGVSQFVAVSDDIRRWLEDEEGIRPNRVRQIYNGVDTERFSPAQPGPHMADSAPVIIGSVGRLQAVKNHQFLIASVAHLLHNCPVLRARLRLRIVGDGPLRASLEAQIQQLSLQDIVTITGFSDDVATQLREMQLFVLPSQNEGISNTLLEAMAAGLPVIATRVGGNVELVAQDETGLLVTADSTAELAGALQRYFEDPGLLSRHGAAGRQRAEQRFSLPVMMKNYDRLYQQAVESLAK